MAERIYGPNQKAGIKIPTTGKGNITSDGLTAFAEAVVLVDPVTGVAAPSGASASPMFFKAAPLVPLGYKQILAAATSTAFTLATGGAIPVGATQALISPEAQGIRWRDDGVDPTTSVGMRQLADVERLYVGPLAAWRGINITAGAIVNITFYQ